MDTMAVPSIIGDAPFDSMGDSDDDERSLSVHRMDDVDGLGHPADDNVGSLPWRDHRARIMSEPRLKRRYRLLRQAAKKARLFMVQKTVRALKQAQSRLDEALTVPDAEARAPLRKKRSKFQNLVRRHEATLRLVKVVDTNQLGVAAYLKVEKVANCADIFDQDAPTVEMIAVLRALLESAAMTTVIMGMRGRMHKNKKRHGKRRRQDDDSDDDVSDDDDHMMGSSSDANEVDQLPKSNRPGQRARRAIAEKQHGSAARHLVVKSKASDPSAAHPSWNAAKLKRQIESTAQFAGSKTKF